MLFFNLHDDELVEEEEVVARVPPVPGRQEDEGHQLAQLPDWLIGYWLIDWLIDWLVDWLIDWLVGWCIFHIFSYKKAD